MHQRSRCSMSRPDAKAMARCAPRNGLMNYSICFKDALGCISRSEFSPFDNDAAAITHAKTHLPSNAMIEVWSGEHLVSRLFRDALTPATSSWENEGGAPSHQTLH